MGSPVGPLRASPAARTQSGASQSQARPGVIDSRATPPPSTCNPIRGPVTGKNRPRFLRIAQKKKKKARKADKTRSLSRGHLVCCRGPHHPCVCGGGGFPR